MATDVLTLSVTSLLEFMELAMQDWSVHIFVQGRISTLWSISMLRVDIKWIWIRSGRCGCLVTWFCYHLIAKPGHKTASLSWPDLYIFFHLFFRIELYISSVDMPPWTFMVSSWITETIMSATLNCTILITYKATAISYSPSMKYLMTRIHWQLVIWYHV